MLLSKYVILLGNLCRHIYVPVIQVGVTLVAIWPDQNTQVTIVTAQKIQKSYIR